MDQKEKMGFEETELRLGIGLPAGKGGGGTATATHEEVVMRKRGFSETETVTTVDLMLNLSSKETSPTLTAGADPTHDVKPNSALPKEKTLLPADPAKPPAK